MDDPIDPAAMWGEDQFNTDLLVPELQMYVTETIFGTSLNAPLVQQIPFYSWKQANESFAYKTKAVEEAVAERRWHTVLMWYERPYRLMMLDILRNRMTNEEFRDALAYVWRDAERPGQNYGKRAILRMFKHAGFVMDSDIVDYESLPPMLTVYRGAHAKHKAGLSWTLKRGKAEWFAKRFNLKGHSVWKTTVDKRKILGWFERRGESEIVVDTRGLVIEEA